MKKIHILVFASLLFSCTPNNQSQLVLPSSVQSVIGLEDTTSVTGHYFNPLKGVSVITNTGEDYANRLHVTGQVDFSFPGIYLLTYRLDEGSLQYQKTRQITIASGTFVPPTNPKSYTSQLFSTLGEGSYRTGLASDIAHPVSPNFMELDLLDRPVPTNQWWTSLAMSNYGGSNGIYNNPLRSSFSNAGVEVTQSGEGFTQFWNPEGNQTIAQFSLALKDFHIKPSSLASAYQTRVIDYSDNTIKVAMRHPSSWLDHMVVTYNQGSPYIFAELGNRDPLIITAGTDGVSNYEYFSLDGNLLNGRSLQTDGLIIKLQQRHVGYQTNPPAQVGQPTYADRYFLLSLPKQSQVTITNTGHPMGLFHRLSILLGEGNLVSLAAINHIQEGAFYHQHAYNLPLRGHGLYRVNRDTNMVENTMLVQTLTTRLDLNPLPVLALLPHQHKLVKEAVTAYTTRTVRGLLKMLIGNQFRYDLRFDGVVPTYTLPKSQTFSRSTMTEYLQSLDEQTNPLNPDNFYNSPTPYWNGKANYPLAQGVMIADQLGLTELKETLLSKLKAQLVNWFTYGGNDDDRYLYYNDRWGTTYYSDNEFNTASEISDHSFTHGYLAFASAVVGRLDRSFYNQYRQMILLLAQDYMNHDATDTRFPVLRSFDRYAGHSWAHGFASFAEGNNLESTGEAINSWVAAYHLAQLENNQGMMDAAIYGYVHETYAAQQYWFDYDQDIWSQKYREYAGVAGIVWGGKYDYATWFGANPTFIYGIQWIPTGEYLASYITGSAKKARLTAIYQKYLNAKRGAVDRWFAYMLPVQALVNPGVGLNLFNANQILADEYPAELSMAYYMIQALQDYQYKVDDAYMRIHPFVSSSVYLNTSNQRIALVYNAHASQQTITFVVNGKTQNHTIRGLGFETITLT
jgi:endoglucanase Acf2